LPTVTLQNVSVGPDSVSFSVQTDIVVGGAVQYFSMSLDRKEALTWMQDNSKTLDEFILMKVQAQYVLVAKLAVKANTLVNKPLTW